jgi:hypothetical protein
MRGKIERLGPTTMSVLIVALLLNGSAAFAQPTLQPADSSLIRMASAMVESTPEIARVWPGFWSNDRAFLLLRPTETALLITSRTPPSEYEAVPESQLPEELIGRAYLRKEYPPGIDENTFDTRYQVGRDTIPALEPKRSTLFGQSDFYMHEAFHGHQRANWVETPGDTMRAKPGRPLVEPSHIESVEFRAQGEVERHILDSALDVSSQDRLLALMHRYLAVRRMRTNGLDDVNAVERSMERREGTAQYVGCYSASGVANVPEKRALSCIREELTTPLDSMRNFPEADARLMRWRQYGTGGALSVILNRLDAENWQERVSEGAALDEILSKVIGYDPKQHSSLARQALESFNYAKLLQEADDED